jgi:hypothetical protein
MRAVYGLLTCHFSVNSLSQNNNTAIVKAAMKARVAGEIYKAALQRLINHLTEAGMNISHRDEILRAIHTLDILDRELKMLSSYQQDEADRSDEAATQE